MDQKTAEKLERLKNYRTRYEITATRGPEIVLVGYAARKGRSGIASMARQHVARFDQFFGKDWGKWGARAADGFTTASGWTVKFSGRTQREAYLAGELPFYVALVIQREKAPPVRLDDAKLGDLDIALAGVNANGSRA